jgi:hypothetical protein
MEYAKSNEGSTFASKQRGELGQVGRSMGPCVPGWHKGELKNHRKLTHENGPDIILSRERLYAPESADLRLVSLGQKSRATFPQNRKYVASLPDFH